MVFRKGYTALHYACEKGVVHLVEALVEKAGGDLQVCMHAMHTYELHVCACMDVQALYRESSRIQVYAHAHVFAYVAHVGASHAQMTTEDDRNALHIAAFHGQARVVMYILQLLKVYHLSVSIHNFSCNIRSCTCVYLQCIHIHPSAAAARMICLSNQHMATLHADGTHVKQMRFPHKKSS